ncbi:hypothetical protein BDA96_05G181500 [Sorghum bicolor]|nr:hypothetical protein BDA96_05G181500 [Sorghum bicolor]
MAWTFHNFTTSVTSVVVDHLSSMKIYIAWITFFEPTLLIGGTSLTYTELGERGSWTFP